MVTYGALIIWSFLTVENLVELNRVISKYLMSPRNVSMTAHNRLVCQHAICTILQPTENTYVAELELTHAIIDPEFYSTPDMLRNQWRYCFPSPQHVITRDFRHSVRKTPSIMQQITPGMFVNILMVLVAYTVSHNVH
jgi:hypothetical protein